MATGGPLSGLEWPVNGRSRYFFGTAIYRRNGLAHRGLTCWENGIAIYRDIAFALAVADLLELPDDLPLMPAVTAAMSIPIRPGDPASLTHLESSSAFRRSPASGAAGGEERPASIDIDQLRKPKAD